MGEGSPSRMISRKKMLGSAINYIDYPEPGPFAYLVDFFDEIGRFCNKGSGPYPFSDFEIINWCNLRGFELDRHESNALIYMSRCYCEFLDKGSEKDCPMPGAETEQSFKSAIHGDDQ